MSWMITATICSRGKQKIKWARIDRTCRVFLGGFEAAEYGAVFLGKLFLVIIEFKTEQLFNYSISVFLVYRCLLAQIIFGCAAEKRKRDRSAEHQRNESLHIINPCILYIRR